jgi:hypothetical protein
MALDVLEQHLSTEPHPVPAVVWRNFSTHFNGATTGSRRL